MASSLAFDPALTSPHASIKADGKRARGQRRPRRGSASSFYATVLIICHLTTASSQNICPLGWTQGPASSVWASKCYREIGPVGSTQDGVQKSGGYSHAECDAVCKASSTTSRLICLASSAEQTWVTQSGHFEGWTSYVQDPLASDYAEPAGGWGWQGCGSTFSPIWDASDSNGQVTASSPIPLIPSSLSLR